MSIFALIGGRGSSLVLNNSFEKHLIQLTSKPNPIVLFCPYATKDMSKSIYRFHQRMKDVDCQIMDLNLENISSFSEYLSRCDIFYVDGGYCEDLISFFKSHGLDKILYEYKDKNIVFAGSSAGAMLYTKASMGDKHVFTDNFHKYNYQMVECLGLLNITICPHFQEEDLTVYNEKVSSYLCDGFGIEEDTMLVIEDDKYYVMKESSYRSIYYFSKDRNYQMIPLYEGVEYEKDSSFRT